MKAVIAGDYETVGGQIRQVLDREDMVCPASHIVSLDLAAERVAQIQPEVVVVVLGRESEWALARLGAIRGKTKGRVLAVGPISDPKLVLRALRSGADDYVDEHDLGPELEVALTRLRDELATQSSKMGRVIAVLAPSGGSGSSTLAVNVAAVLAKKHKTAALFDLKLQAGDLAALLDVKPTHTVADLCQNVDRMDRILFERSLVQHTSGIHLLASPLQFGDVEFVTPTGIRKALNLACSVFPYVVVDLDHNFHPEQVEVLQHADVVLLVLRLDFAALRNTRRTLDYLERLGVDRGRVRLVVNRSGQPREVPAAKAEEALGMKIFQSIPDEPKTINRANNYGVPVVLQSPSAKVAKSIAELATNVNGKHEKPPT
jgi:pilus assembly protein CpaE